MLYGFSGYDGMGDDVLVADQPGWAAAAEAAAAKSALDVAQKGGGGGGSAYYGDPTGRQQSNGGMASQVSDWWGNATTPTKALVIGAGLLAAYGIYSYAKQ